ncbi:MAG: hypothetical protein JOZ78_26145 [Chroococcidiopsidaceae cyanobacterium CP_BM_ER_R8_30]|nr:hypothetical protein [Chroococcidiopsidaceae cyanobacterium CP_BM_ER_R8_30]
MSQNQKKKHQQVVEKTFSKNNTSNYTEKLRVLGKQFNYASNSNYYWSNPELSLLYSTPLYEAASPLQKLALNHLYWVGNYNQTAASEANTIIYNKVTAGVFNAVGGYDTLCRELDFETDQENDHIRAFQQVCYQTKIAITGKTVLGNPLYSKSDKLSASDWVRQLVPQQLQKVFISSQGTTQMSAYWNSALSFVAKEMLKEKKEYYSHYLRELDQKGKQIPAAVDGIVGRIAPQHWLRFFTLNWGISPFMACQYYSIRYTGNAILKNQEYPYFKYFQELEQKGEFIPTPTAISYNHLLDEAFHTTISQTLARDIYKDFPKPTAYEKFVSGQMIYMMQQNLLSGLSGVLPGRCVADSPLLMLFFYKLLKSPLFALSTQEALDWLEKCFCQEHDGFHVGLKYHQRLIESLRRLFSCLDYQWPINRDMGVMAAGGSISKALQNNIKTFNHFSKSVADNS